MDLIRPGKREAGASHSGWGLRLAVGRAVECVLCETNLGSGFVFENFGDAGSSSSPRFQSTADLRVLIWFANPSSGWRTIRTSWRNPAS
jgi:hypothetical protein